MTSRLPAVFLSLRRAYPGAHLQWWPVRGWRVGFGKRKTTLKLYAYRDGPLVFIVDEQTGVTLAFGGSLVAARRALNLKLNDYGIQKLRVACDTELARVNPGPRPDVSHLRP